MLGVAISSNRSDEWKFLKNNGKFQDKAKKGSLVRRE